MKLLENLTATVVLSRVLGFPTAWLTKLASAAEAERLNVCYSSIAAGCQRAPGSQGEDLWREPLRFADRSRLAESSERIWPRPKQGHQDDPNRRSAENLLLMQQGVIKAH